MVKTEMKDGLSGDTELTGFQDWTDAGAGEAGGGAEVPKPRAWEKDGTTMTQEKQARGQRQVGAEETVS